MKNLNSSFLFFLSGIFAATGINVFTGFIGKVVELSLNNSLLISIPWVFLAFFVAMIGVYFEKIQKSYEISKKDNFTSTELIDLYNSKYNLVSRNIRIMFFLAFLSIFIGVLSPFFLGDDSYSSDQKTIKNLESKIDSLINFMESQKISVEKEASNK